MARKVNTRTSSEKEKFDLVTDYHGATNKYGKVQIVDKQMSTHDKLYDYLGKSSKNK